MKTIFTTFFISFLSISLSADGGLIKFYIEGIARSPERVVLRNQLIMVEHGNNNQWSMFKTNTFGEFKVTISIYTPCLSVLPNKFRTTKYYKNLYGKTIRFYTETGQIEIPNNWRNHSSRNVLMHKNYNRTESHNLWFKKYKTFPNRIQERFCEFNEFLNHFEYAKIDKSGNLNLSIESALIINGILWQSHFMKLSQKEILDFLNINSLNPLVYKFCDDEIIISYPLGENRYKYILKFENGRMVSKQHESNPLS